MLISEQYIINAINPKTYCSLSLGKAIKKVLKKLPEFGGNVARKYRVIEFQILSQICC